MADGHDARASSKRAKADRMLQERTHDPYLTRHKYAEPTVCPSCSAVYHQGRWHWARTPEGAESHTCPACQRVHDDYPAGVITLSGAYVAPHRDDILRLARNEEEAEKVEHPLARIMKTEEQGADLVISTTDMHLARRISQALRRAHHGELDYHYAEETHLLRVTWTHA